MPHAPVDGSRLAGRYDVGELLGQGGMAEVRAGYDTRLDREVAIKFLRADLARDEDVREAFEREARAAAQLSHPNVVAIYDTAEHDGQPFIVMERLDGRTLADEIRRGPLGDEQVHRLARQVLAALQAAHDAGVIHRDVKPGNVLLTDLDDAKVADFGIAKSVTDDTTTTGPLFATLAYVAPERLHGEGSTPASDQYSFAVVLYEAATGKRPVSPETPAAILAALEEPRALTEIADPQLRAVIERGMARDPADRFPDARAMADALEQTREPAVDDPDATTPITVRRPTETAVLPDPPALPRHETRGPARRERSFWASSTTFVRCAVVGGVVGALALLGILLSSGGDGDVPPAVNAETPETSTAPPTVDDSSLPPPLADALDSLERQVTR